MNRTGTASRHVDAWTCQTCTFANEPSHVVCAVCFVQKPNAPVGPFNRRNETKDETKGDPAPEAVVASFDHRPSVVQKDASTFILSVKKPTSYLKPATHADRFAWAIDTSGVAAAVRQ